MVDVHELLDEPHVVCVVAGLGELLERLARLGQLLGDLAQLRVDVGVLAAREKPGISG